MRVLHKRLGCQWTHNGQSFKTKSETKWVEDKNPHLVTRPAYPMFPRPLSRPALRPAFLNPQRTFANRLPRPPPKDLPPPETFSSTSRPRQYYSRPQPRDLPPYRVSTEHHPDLLPSHFPLRRKKLLTFFPVSCVCIACLAWHSRDLHRRCWGMGRIPSLRRQPRAPLQLRDAPCTQ